MQLSRPLYDGSTLPVPHLKASQALIDCLKKARRSQHVIGGLEAAVAALGNEKDGLGRLQSRGLNVRSSSVTRVLIICNGASKRFLRQAERAGLEHAPRLAVIRLDLEPEECGQLFFAAERGVKALLIDHKLWAARFFESWLEEFATNG